MPSLTCKVFKIFKLNNNNKENDVYVSGKINVYQHAIFITEHLFTLGSIGPRGVRSCVGPLYR